MSCFGIYWTSVRDFFKFFIIRVDPRNLWKLVN